MKKIIFVVLLGMGLTLMAGELQVGGGLGFFNKNNDLFKDLYGNPAQMYGAEICYMFLKFSGIYVQGDYFSKSGATSLYEQPIKFTETQASAGIKLRTTIIRFGILKELNLFLKGGAVWINYKENSFKTYSGNFQGISGGGGVALWLNRFGAALEAVIVTGPKKSIEIDGLDISEDVDFTGLRVMLKGFIRL